MRQELSRMTLKMSLKKFEDEAEAELRVPKRNIA